MSRQKQNLMKEQLIVDDSGYIFKTNVYTGKSETSENSTQRKLLDLGGEVVKYQMSLKRITGLS